MKIECSTEKLSAAISNAEKITGKNLTLPVLKCILLEAKSGNLKIRATNLDLGIEIDIPVKVQKEGTVAVPGAVLASFIQNIQNSKNITLEVIDGNLSVSTSSNATVIKSLPHEDFPTIPMVSKEQSFKISPEDFVKGLRSVWYSSSTSSMKPELSSVYIYNSDDSIVFVATDSFRLAEKKIKVKKAKDFSHILIPFKNVPEIIRTLESADGEVEVYLNKNQIAFKFDGTYLTSRIIDGVFPDYKQIVPKEYKTEAIVLKQDLIGSFKLANIFSDSFNQLIMRVHPSEKLFEFKSKNSDIGENVNKLDSALSGEDIDISFNHKYITDSFQSIDSDSVLLQFNGTTKAMVLRGASDKSFMYLVMPMNK